MLGNNLFWGTFTFENACHGLLCQAIVELAVSDELLQAGHIRWSDWQLFQAHRLFVGFAGELTQPPLQSSSCAGAFLHGFVDEVDCPCIVHVAHLDVGETPLLLQACTAMAWHFWQASLELVDMLLSGVHHDEVRVWEVTVIVSIRLQTATGSALRALIPVTGFLQHFPTISEQGCLATDFVDQRALDTTEGVHILRLRTSSQWSIRRFTQGHVHISANITLFKLALRNAQCACNIADLADIRASNFCSLGTRTRHWFGHDFDQRHACTVVINQRVVSTFNAAVCTADVVVLTSVIFHVGTQNRDTEGFAIFGLNIEVALAVERLISLCDLIITRHIRVEVVLAAPLAPLVNVAVQGEAQANGVVNGSLVDHWQRAWQAQGHGGELSVWCFTKLVRCRAEQLGFCGQLNMNFQTPHRVVAANCFVEIHQFFSHVTSPQPSSHEHLGTPSVLHPQLQPSQLG